MYVLVFLGDTWKNGVGEHEGGIKGVELECGLRRVYSGTGRNKVLKPNRYIVAGHPHLVIIYYYITIKSFML